MLLTGDRYASVLFLLLDRLRERFLIEFMNWLPFRPVYSMRLPLIDPSEEVFSRLRPLYELCVWRTPTVLFIYALASECYLLRPNVAKLGSDIDYVSLRMERRGTSDLAMLTFVAATLRSSKSS